MPDTDFLAPDKYVFYRIWFILQRVHSEEYTPEQYEVALMPWQNYKLIILFALLVGVLPWFLLPRTLLVETDDQYLSLPNEYLAVPYSNSVLPHTVDSAARS